MKRKIILVILSLMFQISVFGNENSKEDFKMTGEQLKQTMAGVVNALTNAKHSPILRTPADYGMEYEEVVFNTTDGVELKGWFIPAKSNKIVIANHFSPGNRYGYAGHLEEFNTSGGFEVNFLPKYKALHDAGYNILTYDMRNHGGSSEANNGVSTVGALEWQDVIASLHYVREREDTKNMEIQLQSICMGADATFNAIEKAPNEFKNVVSMIAIQPLSGKPMLERMAENFGVTYESVYDAYNEALKAKIGLTVEDYDMTRIAKLINIPTFLLQTKDDLMTKPYDVQAMYDNLPVEDKKLLWVEGTPWRFHGYTYFSEHPEAMIEWYDEHSK